MSPRSLTVLAGLLDTTTREPAILDSTKFIATSQIPNNLTVGSSSDCTEIYLSDFSKFIYFMREGVSIQTLKEITCHSAPGQSATAQTPTASSDRPHQSRGWQTIPLAS